MEEMQRLTDRELEIMLVIWEIGEEAISTGEILEILKARYKRYLQPMQVVLKRLLKKGFLKSEKKLQNHYTPLCTYEEYMCFSMKDYLIRNYPDKADIDRAMSALRHMGLTEEEYEEIVKRLRLSSFL